MKYSENKLSNFIEVEIEPEVILYIKNKFLIHYHADTQNGWYILDKHRNLTLPEVILYKQIFDENGDPLNEPIYDIDEYYAYNKELGICYKMNPDGDLYE